MSHLPNRISDLEDIIDSLEPYEVIHEYYYPSWTSLDEFKALPDFKYFEAVKTISNYLLLTDKKHRYQGEIAGMKYIFNPAGLVDQDDLKDVWESNSTCPLRNNHNSLQMTYYTQKITWNTSIERQAYNQLKLSRPNDKYCWYHKQARLITPDEMLPAISSNVFRYILEYLYGWLLLNHKLVAFRSPKISIYVKNNRAKILVHRTKKLTIGGDLSIYMIIDPNYNEQNVQILTSVWIKKLSINDFECKLYEECKDNVHYS